MEQKADQRFKANLRLVMLLLHKMRTQFKFITTLEWQTF